MVMTLAIAFVTGIAAALMYASVVSGGIGNLLAIFATLPLMMSALGWGGTTAAIAAVASTSIIASLFGLDLGFAFAITVAAPAWWLGHLALLARTPAHLQQDAAAGNPSATQQLDWYPLGRLLLWIGFCAGLVTAVSLFSISSDGEVIRATMRSLISRGLANTAIKLEDSTILTFISDYAPVLLTAGMMASLSINLYAAAKIVALSDRLRRPWPNLHTTTLPKAALIVLAVAILLSFTAGLVALLAQIFAGALLMSFAMIGLAVIHVLTLNTLGRPFLLTIAYVSVPFMIWPLLGFAALGIADTLFGLRVQIAARRPPALHPPHS